MIEIVTLSARPDLLMKSAQWGYEEWGLTRGRTIEMEADRRRTLLEPDGFEQGYMLLDDGVPAGMAGLVRGDLDTRPDLTPWLAGVYVHGPFRGRGHGTRLVRHIEAEARARRCDTLWLFTGTAAGLYRRLGWEDHEPIVRPSGPSLIMRRDLSPPRG